MRDKRTLLIEQLDAKLKVYKSAASIQRPKHGWIKTIRTTINMTMEQLGSRLKMTKQGVKNLEERESEGALSINTLKEVAAALDLKFVYGFVPKDGSIDKMINKKADAIAKKIVMRTNQNMKLEDQNISEAKLNKSIVKLSKVIKQEMHKSLWDY